MWLFVRTKRLGRTEGARIECIPHQSVNYPDGDWATLACMKVRALITVLALGAFASHNALAAPFALYGTGTNDLGTGVLAPLAGTADLHYTLAGGTATIVLPTGFPIGTGAWGGNSATSRWLSNQACGGTSCSSASATFTYSTTFSLAGFNPATAVVKLKYASDDSVTISLNGVNTGLATQGYGALSAEKTISTGFIAGTNTLSFAVLNSGGSVQGVQVQITSTDATPYCTGDFGSLLNAAPCTSAAAPFCAADGSCVASCVTGPGTCSTTSSSVQASITHTGTFCNATSGACQIGCSTDSQCTSGQACVLGACLSGCRGTGGNACPNSKVCTSTDANVGSCVQCTSNAQCSGNTPTCTLNTCVACNSDNGVVGNACPSSANPFCTSAGGCGKCTQSSDCTALGALHAGVNCNTTSGACQSGCNKDSDCTNGYCSQAVCSPKRANGNTIPGTTQQPVPGRNGSDPVLNGDCTVGAGTAACLSNVCFASDDLCGLPNGETCNGIAVCRSAICAADGKCGRTNGSGCILGTECRSGVCNALVCVAGASGDAGTDSGADSGKDAAADGSATDGGSDTGTALDGSSVDGSSVDGSSSTDGSTTGNGDSGNGGGNGGTDDGNLEGGGIACSSSPTNNASTIPAIVALVAMVSGFMRRRRKD